MADRSVLLHTCNDVGPHSGGHPKVFNHAPPDYCCPFCALIAGESTPGLLTNQDEIVYREAEAIAFIASEWRTNNPGHVLVIPARHFENLYELPFEVGAAIQEAIRRVAIGMKRAYGCPGVSTVQHNEPHGNQHVWHFHTHVFPRYENDDIYRSHKRETTREERLHYALLLRDVMG